MSTTISPLDAFKRAALGDDDSYPDKVSFVTRGCDPDDAAEYVWQNLLAGIASIIVTEDSTELMINPEPGPLPVRTINRPRGQARMRVYWRHHETSFDLGRMHHRRHEPLPRRELVGAH